jgi:hypothetical protein
MDVKNFIPDSSARTRGPSSCEYPIALGGGSRRYAAKWGPRVREDDGLGAGGLKTVIAAQAVIHAGLG